MKVEKLVRMANQIAANFDYGPDKAKAAAGVADHLRRFWTPSMRAQLIDYWRQGEGSLCEVATLAVASLAEERSGAVAG